MPSLLVGISGPVFGCQDEADFYIHSHEKIKGAEKEPLVDGAGDIQALAYHGFNNSYSINGRIVNFGNVDADLLVGHLLTTADTEIGATLIIDQVTQSKNVGQWMEVSIEASEYPEINEAAETTTTTTTT